MNDRVGQVIIWLFLLPPFVLALTLHEFAHAYIADRLGDPTPRASGRLTLNPLKHLDLFGLLALFIIHFGWAKPVQVNPRYFQNPRRDMLWVALGGPVMNFFLSLCCVVAIRLFTQHNEAGIFNGVLWYTMTINVYLAVFNLLPIPPLDGSRIMTGLLPEPLAFKYAALERYSLFLILGLFVYITYIQPDLIGSIVHPFTDVFSKLARG